MVELGGGLHSLFLFISVKVTGCASAVNKIIIYTIILNWKVNKHMQARCDYLAPSQFLRHLSCSHQFLIVFKQKTFCLFRYVHIVLLIVVKNLYKNEIGLLTSVK